MAHTDAAFAIGEGHRVCEDYAVTGVGAEGPFVVVSDGCSSSPNTDFGARLLATAAARDLARGALCPTRALLAAAHAATTVGLDWRALDTTLLAARIEGGRAHVTVAGDGVVAAVKRCGSLETWTIRHPTGAPAYLSYHLDAPRLEAYLATHDRREVERLAPGSRGDVAVSSLRDGPYVWQMSLPVQAYRLVALFSDGVSSFHAPSGSVSTLAVLERLLDFKVMRGAFAQRRLRKFLRKECPERGWRHEDDLAVAALVLSEAA